MKNYEISNSTVLNSLGDNLWVTDLGCDSIYHFKMTPKNVTQVGVTKVGEGRGPRHMITIEERGLALVVCELMNILQV